MAADAKRKVRCAIYTRKSTEDGLEQEYNSLDAQYDACAAYALSQRHEGWTLLSERYDDGGFSGGNMERPGLKKLMADVETGKVDIILLYKMDRLTRSLSDFARIVDVLDRKGASFVSITQSFNTTTSMGRLTLNMLLSFAQFEREVTGERIRDKIAASKKKGIWMGGNVPLGYDVKDRRLVVNENEAELVRHIMRRYIKLGSVSDLVEELAAQGYRTKVQKGTSGPHKGGCTFQRGTIYHLLSNRIYRGMIVHKGDAYPGEHAAIVPEDLWDAVQHTVASRSSGGASKKSKTHPSLLIGKLFDGLDRPMTPTHSKKGVKRYRYYISRVVDGAGEAVEPLWRVTATDIEKLVYDQVLALLSSQSKIHALLKRTNADAQLIQRVFRKADIAAAIIRSGNAIDRARLVTNLIDKVKIYDRRLELSLSAIDLFKLLEIESHNTQLEEITLSCEVDRVRKGHAIRLVIPASDAMTDQRPRNQRLVSLIREAHQILQIVYENPRQSLSSLASSHGKCRTHMARFIAITCLAPDIISAIMEGTQPVTLKKSDLLSKELPMCWKNQRVFLGFTSQTSAH
ncbi:recombinase family protein [Sphingorhabdus contaminans]|uniref:Recombinase family protein n=1 Tax=Sphingorhabdus contaminans TaxID=1343899 RepID=A0A553WA86_9SPHN|nr:recombinase family protein [Sphingorhabdus contaminans]TSB01582.1 recombinase family protein [Sphingorhabdus contaminans]